MPKLDLDSIEQINRTGYPEPYASAMARRRYRKLAGPAGIEDFGVSHVVLEPGGISSQRHWHEGEDEFVWVLEGEVVLIEDEGETVLTAGDCAGWKAGVKNGHHIVNRSGREAVLLEVGTRTPGGDRGEYPDIDLRFGGGYSHKDGAPYPPTERRT